MQNEQIEYAEDDFDELTPGTTLLHGQYVIESYLVRGGFGITYLARDSLERQVVIKECFPSTICCRFEGQVHAAAPDRQAQFSSILRHFLREARRLARLSHPNIVGVHQVFEENSTAYMALDYVDGMDMLSVIDEAQHRLTPELIRSALMKSLGAINYIHSKGILHRDISPDNFLLDGADNLTLIDFGAAREHATKANRELSTLLAVKDGYSPQEFYQPGVTQCASSDLYSLGATFYHIITGNAPPHSQQRLAAIAANKKDPYRPLVTITQDFDRDFLAAIDKALEVFPEKRLQSAQEWSEAIDAERRRQAAVARAKLDTTIQLKISKLVADTNSSLHAPLPGETPDKIERETPPAPPLRMPRAPIAAQDKRERTQPVDMFGTPIDDVEAWLKAQDRLAARSSRSGSNTGSSADTGPKHSSANGRSAVHEPQRSRFFRSLIARLSTPRPEISK